MFAILLFGLSLVAGLLPPPQVSAAMSTPRVGEHAPDFTLPDIDGKPVNLARFIASGVKDDKAPRGANWVVLIFYRGYW